MLGIPVSDFSSLVYLRKMTFPKYTLAELRRFTLNLRHTFFFNGTIFKYISDAVPFPGFPSIIPLPYPSLPFTMRMLPHPTTQPFPPMFPDISLH